MFDDQIHPWEQEALVTVSKMLDRVLGGVVGCATLQKLPARGSDRKYLNGEMVWIPGEDASWVFCIQAEEFVAPDIEVATGEVSYPS